MRTKAVVNRRTEAVVNRGETDEDAVTPDLLRLCRDATERSPLPVIVTEGREHIVRYANLAFCCLCGKEREALIERPFAEAVPEGAENGGLTLLDRVYHTGKTESITHQAHSHSTPSPVYWSYVAWAVLDEGQHPVGVMIQVIDTTETALTYQRVEKANEEIREINQQLVIAGVREQELAELAAAREQLLRQSQKMESIGRLAGGIAHDFNNILTVILGFTELAEGIVPPDNEVQELLHNIHKAGERAAGLTSQLLAFARKQIIAPKVINLNALILDMGQMLHHLPGEQIELVLLLEPDVGQVKLDPSQFGQVLINLVVNARDAMPDGGKLTIETAHVMLDENYARQHGEVTPGDYVLLVVSDTGMGMTEEMQTHLFEPFFTTKEQGKGTGMGLAICYGIVKQSGGHIQVDSAPDEGTTFRIYLPRMEEASTPARDEKASPLPQGTEVILLVEDEPMVRNVGARTLRRQGYTVFEAANGREALRLVDDYPGEIDLLVTDVVMPQMGGTELADRLHVTHPNIKVLYTSGYTDDVMVRHRVLVLGLAFLQKPFTPAALANKVREVLESAMNF